MPIKPPTVFAQPANRGQTHVQNIPWTAGAKQLADQVMSAFQMMYGMKMQEQLAADRQAKLAMTQRGLELREQAALQGVENEMWDRMQDVGRAGRAEQGLDIQEKGLTPGSIRIFETATEFGEEDRGTPEYQKAYVQFMQDTAQAKHIASPGAQFVGPKFAMDMRKQFDALPEVKDYKETARKHAVMGSAWEEAQKTKNFVAVDQALITLFNKMTDPASVVRESEYARTASDLAVWNRLKGKMTKVIKGGASLSMDDRKALMDMGNKFMNAYSEVYKRTGRQYRGYATKYQIDPEDVVPIENLQIPQYGAPSAGSKELPPLEF